MRRVLLTGACGGVGQRLRTLLRPHCDTLVLSDLKAPADLLGDETFISADLADFDAVQKAVVGVDSIVHLGGYSVEGPWAAILSANIVGTYNLFEAARLAGVKRVIFASSNHVAGFYSRQQVIDAAALPLPDSRYGVSKAFGEALGAFYAHKFGLGVLCIRIGNVADAPVDERRLAIWLKPDDLVALVRIGLETPDLVYDVVYGMSDNAGSWWDNTRALELGYRPSGRSQDWRTEALAAQANMHPDAVADRFQGGAFCSIEGPKARQVP